MHFLLCSFDSVGIIEDTHAETFRVGPIWITQSFLYCNKLSFREQYTTCVSALLWANQLNNQWVSLQRGYDMNAILVLVPSQFAAVQMKKYNGHLQNVCKTFNDAKYLKGCISIFVCFLKKNKSWNNGLNFHEGPRQHLFLDHEIMCGLTAALCL